MQCVYGCVLVCAGCVLVCAGGVLGVSCTCCMTTYALTCLAQVIKVNKRYLSTMHEFVFQMGT